MAGALLMASINTFAADEVPCLVFSGGAETEKRIDLAEYNRIFFGDESMTLTSAPNREKQPVELSYAQFNHFQIAYANPTPEIILAESITLDPVSAKLRVSSSLSLTAYLLPYSVTDKRVTWSSSNEDIVSVSNIGLVSALSVGDATITASTVDGSQLSATCEIQVLSDDNPDVGISGITDNGMQMLFAANEKTLTVESDTPAEFSVVIFNAQGLPVVSRSVESGEAIRLSHLSAGVYVAKANGTDKQQTLKFVLK